MRYLLLPLIFTQALYAADFSKSARGTSSGEFLKLGAGARAAALGEAYSTLANDAHAIYWNPAALTQLSGKNVAFSHAVYLQSVNFDFAGYGQTFNGNQAFGVGLLYLSPGEINRTDEVGRDIGSYKPHDSALYASYAISPKSLPFWNGLSLGITAKYVESKIVDKAETASWDAGLLSPAFLNQKLRTSLVFQNISGGLKFDQKSDPLPTQIKLGAAYSLTSQWVAGADVRFPRDNDPYVALGMERTITQEGQDFALSGRIGINTLTMSDIDGLSGISFGVGLNIKQWRADYALVPYGDLDSAHRLSLSFKF